MARFGPEVMTLRSGRKVILRHCEARDVGSFAAFQDKIARETTHTLQVVGRVPSPERLSEVWESDAEHPVALRLGCFVDDQLIGQIGFQPASALPHPWTRHVGQFGMMIIQEYWGQGLGRRMLEVIEAHARNVGVSRIEAKVRNSNDRGVGLYKRMGYQIEGRRQAAALIDGMFCDELYIAKILQTQGAALTSWRPPVLTTDRLMLRPVEMSDAEAIYAYASDPQVSQYTMWEPHATRQDSERYISEYILAHYRDEEPEALAICLKSAPERMVGTVGCFWVSEQARTMELAYALARPLWGQGLVAEAARAMLIHCFANYEVSRIQARCKAENLASARVMEKLGMKREGRLRSSLVHRGRTWDMIYCSLLQGELSEPISSRAGSISPLD